MSTGDAGGSQSLAEKNAEHFDKIPNEWPQWVQDLHRQITDFLGSPEFPSWLGLKPTGADAENQGPRRMLDYACGDGVISAALQPHFGSIVGVDVAGAMLAKFEATAARLGLPEGAMVGVRGDLLADDVKPTEPPLADDRLWGFDLVATSMALHHFADPPLAIQRLAARLKPGGALLVIDWTPLDFSTPAQRAHQAVHEAALPEIERRMKEHAASHTISKPYGFTRQEMMDMFDKAGCGRVTWKIAEELSPIPVMENLKGQLFWACATKTA